MKTPSLSQEILDELNIAYRGAKKILQKQKKISTGAYLYHPRGVETLLLQGEYPLVTLKNFSHCIGADMVIFFSELIQDNERHFHILLFVKGVVNGIWTIDTSIQALLIGKEMPSPSFCEVENVIC